MDTMSMVSSVSSTIQGPSTPTPLIEKKVMALVIQMLEFEPHGSGGGSSNPSSSMLPNESSSPFHWDTCLPDEMFVLKESSLDAFLKCTFHSPRFPSPHLVVADLWFLVVRYSVYYQPDLFPLFFNALFTKASECSTYISSLMSSVYWFYTWYRFVHFLKRDPKVSLDIHVGGAYLDACLDHLQILYTSTLKWIHVELDKCITKMFVTSKPQRWKTLFKLSQGSMPGSPAANISSLLVFLSAFLQVLQVYQVHRTIVKQVYLHVFSYLNFKFHWHFAQLPVHSRLLALEWRMQWSQLEAWAQHHSYLTPERDDLLNTLIPFTGLLQFIHIWSQWSSLEQVFDLTKTLGVWKPILKRVLPNYRFQDDEEKDAPSLFKECMAWLAMEPDMGPQVCGGEPSSPLVLPLDFGEPLSEQDWVEASEVPVEDRPTLTLEWLELLQRQVP
ncbi:hypothetical protein HMI56_000184 [Coelomomyces lativittatus]|nr:hypothetical protein HMI56_000184 [Coelomomyces lativittatus]